MWQISPVYALLIAHIGAALLHHFAKGDDVLKRMTYGS